MTLLQLHTLLGFFVGIVFAFCCLGVFHVCMTIKREKQYKAAREDQRNFAVQFAANLRAAEEFTHHGGTVQ